MLVRSVLRNIAVLPKWAGLAGRTFGAAAQDGDGPVLDIHALTAKKKAAPSPHNNKKVRQLPPTEEHALKVTLLQGEAISVVSLAEAKRLAIRRDLKLIKIVDQDAKSKRPIYRLMTGHEYHEEDVKHRLQMKEAKKNTYIKGEKLLPMNSRISEHDFTVKMNNAVKWLGKSYEVRITIEGSEGDAKEAEKLYATIEKKYGECGKIVQKRIKGGVLKFQMLPPKKEKDSEAKPPESEMKPPEPETELSESKTPSPPLIQQTRAFHSNPKSATPL